MRKLQEKSKNHSPDFAKSCFIYMKRIIIPIFLSFWVLSGFAQDLKVRVLAPDNTPLFRATVSINGTAVGLTDSLGMIAISARRVAFKILSNYDRVFYQGTSYDGDYANGSLVGLAEVQFFTGSTLNFEDINEKIENYVIIPNGKNSVTLTITPKRTVGDKAIDITILDDFTRYVVDIDAFEATVNVK